MARAISTTYSRTSPTVFNWSIYAGEDFVLTMQASPVGSILGWTFISKAKDRPVGGTTYLSYLTGSGIAITDSGNGVLTLSGAHADTISLDPGFYWWDVQRNDAGNYQVLLTGMLQIMPEISV